MKEKLEIQMSSKERSRGEKAIYQKDSLSFNFFAGVLKRKIGLLEEVNLWRGNFITNNYQANFEFSILEGEKYLSGRSFL